MKTAIKKIIISILFISILGSLLYIIYEYKKVSDDLTNVNDRHSIEIKELNEKELKKTEELAQKDAYILFLESENADLNKQLADEKDKGVKFEEQVSIIGKTIEEIQKIQNTDSELLKKYSKIYFLNENYKPKSLSSIPREYIVNPKAVIEIYSAVLPFLTRMIKASEDELGATSSLRVISGFRSFDDQKDLKSTYRTTYGSGANKFSADQGYSEHQLGTTVDLSTDKLAFRYTSFGESATYKWMQEKAYKYGFILSYPKGNTHYMYEPWHWRFVGVDLATELHNRGIYFYDMEQREIDTYIGKLLDY